MTVVRLLQTIVDAAPGEIVTGNIEIHNDGSTDAWFRVRVVGTGMESPPFHTEIPAGDTVRCEVPIPIALTLGIGQHATAYEVTSSRPGEAAVLTPFTVSIGSVERVLLTATPATIRARRRARFHLDVANNEELPVALSLDASAPDVEITLTPDRVELAPGQRIVASAKVKGPRHWSGEPTQHNLILTARGRASSTSITTPYIQRPVFVHRARMLIAGLTVIALWLGAIGGVALWWSNRDTGGSDVATQIVAVDTNGDGIPDTFFDAAGNQLVAVDTNGDGVPDSFTDAAGNPITGTDTNGDGVPDAFVDADGNPIRGIDTDGDGVVDTFVDANGDSIRTADPDDQEVAARPTSADVRGTITAAGSLDDVQIALAPIALGAPPPANANLQAFAGAGAGTATKIWSARFGRLDTAVDTRLTQPVPPLSTTPGVDGVWLFGDVPLGQSYEIVFSKPGFDTQSFVITPPADGSPVQLDVELVASVGAISGRVIGPAGGLGGVAITVTDGTLTFETTSATEGNIGSWSLEGLSTPGVYTVSAALRGFGTEVLQIQLGGGERRTSADITMQRGVGTVSGRVLGENGSPLGGVTITATDGATTRTTTSLTEGNIGFFSIPQLDIPSTYTLTVELPGFVTQTRRVSLGGSIDGIDFNLVSSSLRLTGRVTSADGSGIVGAGVTLSTGDLQFRVPTAAAPDAGAFAVDDLPPGQYTVTFDHFQHVPATELRTLVAGQPPAPLDVTLQRSSGPPPIGTGSLRVEVIDNDPTSGNPREVANATVRVIDVTTGTEVARDTQAGNNFLFSNLAVATYSVVVSAPSYNTATLRRVTVGLQQRSETVGLQRLGAASGTLVDPTDPAKRFAGYRVLLFFEPRRPGDQPFVRTAPSNAEGVWQTSEDALVTGTYSIEIERVGAVLDGYLVRGNQVLDPTAGGPMRFVVSPDATEPIVVSPIVADPHPEISGNVYRADSTTPSGVSPIDNSGLAVTMSCPGGVDASAIITDTLTVVGSDRNDTYRIPREVVDLNRLNGDCELTVSATPADPATPPQFAPVTVPLLGVQPSVGATRSDRQLNIALTAPAPDIRGTVFWTDTGASTPADRTVLLEGVPVASDRITRYEPGPGATLPQARSTLSDDTSAADGTWSLPGQVFGTAAYSFTAPNFDPAVVTFTIDESGLQLPPATDSNATVTGDLSTGFAVELRRPNPGSIEGTISIESIGTKRFDDIIVSAIDPAGAPASETGPSPRITRPTPNTFRIADAMAGTWTINFSEPDNHDLFGTGAAQRRPIVGPNQDVIGVNTSFVELGTLELTLVGVDPAATPINRAPTVTLTPSFNLVPGTEAVTATMTPKPGGPANTFVLRNIKVATPNPAAFPVSYDLSVELAGFDTTSAQTIPVSFLAGSVDARTVALPSFGTVAGSIVGRPDTAGTSDEPLPIGSSTRVLVQPISGPGGVPNGASFVPTTTANTYSFGGPTGWYRIHVASVGYQPTSIELLVQNEDDLTRDFALDLVAGAIDLTVVRDLVGRTPVPGATYQAFPGSCPRTGATPTPAGVNLDGEASISGLLPGPYCLTVRELDGNGDEAAFPAIATVMVGRSTTLIPADVTTHAPIGTITTVTAPLPEIRASVAGTVRAVNRNGDPVPLPASITLSIDYATTVLEVDNAPGGATSNTEQRTDTATVAPTAGDSSATYTFSNVPVGVHTITPQGDIPGYTPTVSPATVTVGTTGGFGPTPANDIVYVVENLDVVVDLDPDDTRATNSFLFATPPTLTSPVGNRTYSSVFDATNRRLTFAGVAPEIGNFQLAISDPLHTYAAADLGFAVAVLPTPAPPASRVQTVNVPAAPSAGRVTGSLTQFDLPGSSGGVASGTRITLTPTGATPGSVQVITTGGVATTSFSFDAVGGTYELTVELAGYTEPVFPITLVNGQVVTQNLRIDRLAPITATINAPATVPAGTTVWLVRNNNPADDIELVRTGTSNVWTMLAAPGSYRFVEARAPLHRTARQPGGTNPVLNLAIGTSFSPNLTLSPRSLTVNVVQAGGTTPITDATVTISIDSTTVTDTSSPYVFVSTDAGTAIPVTGSGTATASAPGRRTNTRPIADQTTQTVSIPLSPTVTATGSIVVPNAAVADEVIWAESPGVPNIYGSISSNTYTIAGLTNNLTTGAPRTWTIRYDEIGVGTSTGTAPSFTVTAESANAVAPGTITVTPNPIAVTFTVTGDVPAGPIAGATITIDGTAFTPTTDGGGIAIINVPENSGRSWTAAASGYVTSTARTLAPFTSRNAVTADANASVVLASRTLRLDVQNPDGTPVPNGTQVIIACPVAIAPCPTLPSGNVTGGSFTFLAPVAAGTYPISAALGGRSATTTVTVATSGGLGVIAANPLVLPL
jgi:hypothetical protein